MKYQLLQEGVPTLVFGGGRQVAWSTELVRFGDMPSKRQGEK